MHLLPNVLLLLHVLLEAWDVRGEGLLLGGVVQGGVDFQLLNFNHKDLQALHQQKFLLMIVRRVPLVIEPEPRNASVVLQTDHENHGFRGIERATFGVICLLEGIGEGNPERVGGARVTLQEYITRFVADKALVALVVEIIQSKLVNTLPPVLNPFLRQLRAPKYDMAAREGSKIVVQVLLGVVQRDTRCQLVLPIVLGALKHRIQRSSIRPQCLEVRFIHVEARFNQVLLD